MNWFEISVILLLGLLNLLNQVPIAFTFITKGTVESVSGKLVRPVYRTAKISRLFSTKQLQSSSSSTTPWPIEIIKDEKIVVTSTEEPKPEALVQETIGNSAQESSKFSIYNRSNNSLISSETWKDLNTVLSEEDMKRFLTTLPLHTLRSLTALTKKSPELGQKQLIRLILDRGHRLKINKAPDQPAVASDSSSSAENERKKVLPSEIQQNGSIPTYLNMENLSTRLNEMKKHLLFTSTTPPMEITENSLNPSTLTTPTLVLDPPYNILRRPTTSIASEIDEYPSPEDIIVPESDRKHRFLTLPQVVPGKESSPTNNVKVIMMGSPNSQDDSDNSNSNDPRQIVNSFNLNSGYYIPPLTSTENPNGDKNSAAASNNINDHSLIHDSSSRYHPQDPENTFHPNVDTFLKPPLIGTNEVDEDLNDNVYSPSTSSVWVPSNKVPSNVQKSPPPSLKEVQRSSRHPFSGFNSNTKLQQAESQDNENEYYQPVQQQHSRPFTIPDDSGINSYRFPNNNKPPLSNPDYNYIHSTVHTEPPKHTYKVVSSSDNQDNNYVQNIPPSSYHQNAGQQIIKTNEDSYKSHVEHIPSHFSHDQPLNLNHHQNSLEVKHKPQFSSSFSIADSSPNHGPTPGENSPGHSSGGWQYLGEQGHHDSSYPSSHHELGMWDKVKSYFSTGKKSKAEKVFEISIAILSFLAFGGYLVMLIYQVLLVSSTVPLFPILSTTIPQNPTLIGLLLGRGMNSNSSQFDLRFPGQEVAEKYINDLEVVVKQAMEKVKRSFEGKPVQVKGDLGH